MTATIEPIRNPFKILVDSAESQPFTFHGLTCDADKDGAPLFVPTRWTCLGRHPASLGDYSIDGLAGQVAVERKSLDDVWGTVLGWESDYQKAKSIAGRRDRFRSELQNLAALNRQSSTGCRAIIVVEADLQQCLDEMPEWGEHTAAENRKIFYRTYISWTERYLVPWQFYSSRRLAEISAFRFLEKHWQHLPRAERARALDAAAYPLDADAYHTEDGT